MAGFVKIYGSKLITSSLWDEAPEVRLVFLSLLAIADAVGYVDVPNERSLARVLNLPLEYLTGALAVLMAPDLGSRTPDHEGRRVLRRGSGWQCVNYEQYREFRTVAQEETRQRVAKHRAVTCNASNGDVTNVRTEAEAEADTEAEGGEKISGAPAKPATPPDEVLLTFPCDGQVKQWHLTKSQVREWRLLFPSVDLGTECRAALAWVLADPNRKKTANGMKRFLVGWFSRTQNRGGGGGRGGPPRTRTGENVATAQSWLEKKKAVAR